MKALDPPSAMATFKRLSTTSTGVTRRRRSCVFEAVHLLMFFPLFVVFVGVDSRWVSRALYRHYEQMLGRMRSNDRLATISIAN